MTEKTVSKLEMSLAAANAFNEQLEDELEAALAENAALKKELDELKKAVPEKAWDPQKTINEQRSRAMEEMRLRLPSPDLWYDDYDTVHMMRRMMRQIEDTPSDKAQVKVLHKLTFRDEISVVLSAHGRNIVESLSSKGLSMERLRSRLGYMLKELRRDLAPIEVAGSEEELAREAHKQIGRMR